LKKSTTAGKQKFFCNVSENQQNAVSKRHGLVPLKGSMKANIENSKKIDPSKSLSARPMTNLFDLSSLPFHEKEKIFIRNSCFT
jgi:hypothetical protein